MQRQTALHISCLAAAGTRCFAIIQFWSLHSKSAVPASREAETSVKINKTGFANPYSKKVAVSEKAGGGKTHTHTHTETGK